MPKFKIKFHGERFRMQTLEKRFWGSRTVWKDMGFYTTRFVEAEDEEAAAILATALLVKELEDNSMYSENSVLEAVSSIRDDDGFDAHAPGSGFTFYSEDD
jgi:hypothetical protein